MAMTSAAVSSSTFAAAAIASCGRNSPRGRKTRVVHMGGLNSFGGLKADTNIASLGLPKCTNQSFAMVLSSLKSPSKGRGSGGGALSSTCSAAAEIFKIAAIMNGLVLIGVAVGFVLLRVEASVEEAE
ncbi:PetM of cytochrome b6/f complex subunit 7 [Cinnamomum micranthum f. kanehirae]|uniref:PetM of cytochrome b6/f complex subunit 7 n=1 Tax=Cinnamomum micranthum f. kanehirae TaxID=337451 RepID=A0A3S3Q271_9MAGN|nr:PetM of cytochrome b6/f complex subunit 7 [Cinnamomum micranthum f. kanehirae]